MEKKSAVFCLKQPVTMKQAHYFGCDRYRHQFFSISHQQFPAEIREKATSLFPGESIRPFSRATLIQEIWRRFFQLLAKLPDMDYMARYRRNPSFWAAPFSLHNKGDLWRNRQRHYNTGELVVETATDRKVLSFWRNQFGTVLMLRKVANPLADSLLRRNQSKQS